MTTHAVAHPDAKYLAAVALLVLIATNHARAGEAPNDPSSISWGGSVTLVNDYIWRGQSQTWGKPALQVGVEGTHSSGLYAGAWASNVSSQWVPGADIETDWYVGHRGQLLDNALAYDLNLLYVFYPGANFDQTGFNLPPSSPHSVEASVALSHDWISVKTGAVLTKFYGWNTDNSGIGAFAGDPGAGVTGDTAGSWFIEANINYALAPGWNLIGQIGRETIRHSTGLDWSYYKLGVTRTFDSWTASAAYSWSSDPDCYKDFVGLKNNGDTYDDAKPRFLISIARSF
jgi:hypothetical protein